MNRRAFLARLWAAEIIHQSICDRFGTFKAYSVDLSRSRIITECDQLEARHLFGSDLGPSCSRRGTTAFAFRRHASCPPIIFELDGPPWLGINAFLARLAPGRT